MEAGHCTMRSLNAHVDGSREAALPELKRRSTVTWPEIRLGMLAVMAGLVGISVLIKGAQTRLTYDEAYSLSVFAQSPRYLLWMDQANNQFLNTLSIYLLKNLLGDSEFVIRLPNMLCGLLYIAVATRYATRTQFPFLTFSVFAFVPYMMDFFALARGYGIATSFVLFSCVYYCRDMRVKDFSLACMYLFVASLAIYPLFVLSLVAIGTTLIGTILERGLQAKDTRSFIAVGSGFTTLAAIPAYLLMQVTAPGKDVFATRDNFVLSYLSTIESFFDSVYPSYVFLALALISFGLLVRYHISMRSPTKRMIAVNVFILLAYFILAKVSGRPFPTGRVLLPLYPLHATMLIAILEDVGGANETRGIHAVLSTGASILSVLLAVNFVSKLDLMKTHDWADNQDILPTVIRALADGTCAPRRMMENPAGQYYRDRLGMQNAWSRLTCSSW